MQGWRLNIFCRNRHSYLPDFIFRGHISFFIACLSKTNEI
jgi:hypothetical protein